MITNEFAEAATEINEILSYLPNEYIQRIPKKLRDFFKKVKSNNYISKIDPYKPLGEQELKPKTKTILTIIYWNYWCNEEEKRNIDRVLIENDQKYEKELKEKYNPDNLFKNKQEQIVKEKTNLPIEIREETFFKKLVSYIKRLFNKTNQEKDKSFAK